MLKNKKEIVNDGIWLKLCISNISTFFERKTIVLQNFLIKSRIHTIKQTKNVKNTKELKSKYKQWNSEKDLYLKDLYFFNQISRIFQNSLIKSIIRIIRHHKMFRIL